MDVMVALRAAPIAQNVLAETIGAHAVKLVAILNDLERAELIHRRRDIADRRRHTVSLSELGRARLAAVDIAREKLETALFETLSVAQRATLTLLLTKIEANL